MSLSSDGTVMTMPVQPAYQGNGNGMWGGDWSSWIILFLIFGLFGGWGNGFGGFGGQNGGVGSEVQRGFDHSAVVTKLDGITQGICDSTYAITNSLTNGFNNTNMGMMQGFNGVERGFCNLSAQLADCCCGTQRAIDGVRYDMAAQVCDTRNTIQTTTRDIIDNQNQNARAILDALTAQRIEAKDAKIAEQGQQLFAAQLAASQAAQNETLKAYMSGQLAYYNPRPVPAFQVPAPYQYGNCGTGCGCGSCA